MATTSLIYRFGEFLLDTQKGCLFKGEQEVKLRPKVYETLKYLAQNSGRLVSKPELMQAVWPDSFVTDDSLVQCTLELRRALDDHQQQLLKLCRGADICSILGSPILHPPLIVSLPPKHSRAFQVAVHRTCCHARATICPFPGHR